MKFSLPNYDEKMIKKRHSHYFEHMLIIGGGPMKIKDKRSSVRFNTRRTLVLYLQPLAVMGIVAGSRREAEKKCGQNRTSWTS
jgi:hypothetical protein